MPRRLALIATSLALVVVLVGCGSDDDSSDDGGDTTTTAEEESTTTAEEGDATEPGTEESTAPDESTTESTEAEDETTTTAAENTGDGEEEFCAAYTEFNDMFDDLPDETLEDIQSGSVLLRDTLAELTEVTPEELAEDMDLLAQAGADLVEAVEGATTVEEATEAGGEVFGGDDFVAAADRVDTYYRERCPQANDDQADG